MSILDAAFLSQLGDIQIESPIASARPNLPQGNVNIGGIQGTVVGNVPSGAIQPPSGMTTPLGDNQTSSIFTNGVAAIKSASEAINAWGNENLGGQKIADASTATIGGWVSDNLLSSRFMSAVIGVVCIGGGLFMFQSTRELVVSGVKTAAKVAV